MSSVGLKYGPGSVLAGKNVISGFGTNDYELALKDYITKMNTYQDKKKSDARAIKIQKAKDENKDDTQAWRSPEKYPLQSVLSYV